MRHLILLVFLIGCFALKTPAQVPDDFNKFEVFASYSHLFLERSEQEVRRRNEAAGIPDIFGMDEQDSGAHGVNLAATSNIRRYFGLKLDFSAYRDEIEYKDRQELPAGILLPPSTIKPLSNSLYTFMGGYN